MYIRLVIVKLCSDHIEVGSDNCIAARSCYAYTTLIGRYPIPAHCRVPLLNESGVMSGALRLANFLQLRTARLHEFKALI